MDVLSVDMKIKRAVHNYFTVLLIIVPIEVWIIIPDLPGYNFVSHATSNNGFITSEQYPIDREQISTGLITVDYLIEGHLISDLYHGRFPYGTSFR